jgi:hypothetical protein
VLLVGVTASTGRLDTKGLGEIRFVFDASGSGIRKIRGPEPIGVRRDDTATSALSGTHAAQSRSRSRGER